MTPDYQFYQECYRGRQLEEAQFGEYVLRGQETVERMRRIWQVSPAADLLEQYTEEQLYGMAACAAAEALALFDRAAAGQESQSATVGAVHFSTGAAQGNPAVLGSQTQALLRAAGRYLDIFRGVR